jgi:hypothetical protein
MAVVACDAAFEAKVAYRSLNTNDGVINYTDHLVVFFDGIWQETAGAIELALRIGRTVRVVYPEGDSECLVPQTRTRTR